MTIDNIDSRSRSSACSFEIYDSFYLSSPPKSKPYGPGHRGGVPTPLPARPPAKYGRIPIVQTAMRLMGP